jgi:putative tryptophan/tyrosine transport system substrate-binding protein
LIHTSTPGFDPMLRRNFIGLLGGATATWSLAALAQQSAMPVIGLLASASPSQWADRLRAFRQGLSETGYEEGKNVAIEYRWAEGHNDRLPAMAAELVRRRVTVIVVLGNTVSALAAKAATAIIPIIFRVAANPVELGLVASLSRPGGNLTGVTTLGVEVGPKQLDLLHEMISPATVVALLVNPTNPILAEIQQRELQLAARTLGLQLHVLKASTDRDFDAVFASLASLRAGGLLIGVDAFFNSRNEILAALAVRHAVPTISTYREFAEAGGLISYGGSIPDASRQAGVYTGRILKGEKPADLPVQMVTKLELVINLKTARALGLTVSLALQTRADAVID